ncbi:hypothetical protein GALL_478570 [mine drainage metagenome]|uniref:Uncharacterized protein n=1 Tax=mine drainage metagenome TaxID=410659 RepID=A0A1J5PH35_9ZZZZ
MQRQRLTAPESPETDRKRAYKVLMRLNFLRCTVNG